MRAGDGWERGVAYSLRGWGDVGGGYRGTRRVRRGYVLAVDQHDAAVDVVTVLDAETGWAGPLHHIEIEFPNVEEALAWLRT